MTALVLFVAGWALATFGVAAVTSPWAWAISAGALLIVLAIELSSRDVRRR